MKPQWLFVIFSAVGLSLAVLSPANAEDKQLKPDFYMSFFGGWASPYKTDVRVDSPGTSQLFTFHDVELSGSRSLGGKIGVWMNLLRERTGLDLGFEIDVTNFSPEVKAGQRLRATGTSGGATVTSATTAQRDINSNVVALNILIRKRFGVTDELPNGRWFPYVGIGGGGQRSTFGSGGIKTDPAFQAVAGAKVFITRHIALFGEYKFTHSEQTLGFISSTTGTPFEEKYTFNVNHAVGGLAFHF